MGKARNKPLEVFRLQETLVEYEKKILAAEAIAKRMRGPIESIKQASADGPLTVKYGPNYGQEKYMGDDPTSIPIPPAAAGISVSGVTYNDNTRALMVTYEAGRSPKGKESGSAFTLIKEGPQGLRGEDCDFHGGIEDSTPGCYTEYAADGKRIKVKRELAAVSGSMTGLAASATALKMSASAVSISLTVQSSSVTGISNDMALWDFNGFAWGYAGIAKGDTLAANCLLLFPLLWLFMGADSQSNLKKGGKWGFLSSSMFAKK